MSDGVFGFKAATKSAPILDGDRVLRTVGRAQDGDREVDGATGTVIGARDVVVINTEVHFTTDFGLDPAGNPKLDMTPTGSGTGAVFRDGLRQDIVYGPPSPRRAPAGSITILLTLALGLGVNAAMFSLLDVIFLRPPAGVVHPDAVRRVWSERNYTSGREFTSVYDFSQYAALVTAFDGGYVAASGTVDAVFATRPQ
mgnify:CR=1 FL=1